MILNDGARAVLSIPGVFAGSCGVARGLVAFVPPVPILSLKTAYSAFLDGKPVVLANVKAADIGPGYTAQVLG